MAPSDHWQTPLAMDLPRELELLVEAKFHLVVIDTHEELRAVDLITALGRARQLAVYRWKVSEGLVRRDAPTAGPGGLAKPAELLRQLASAAAPGVYLLLDLHPFLDDPVHARLFKDALGRENCTFFLVGHGMKLPADLDKLAARFELPAPGREELLGLLKEEVAALRSARPEREPMAEPEAVEGLLQHLSGLTAQDARRVIRQVLLDDGTLTLADFDRIYQAKRELLGREGVLSLEKSAVRLDDLAGLANLKRWLLARREAFLGDPAVTRLEVPKGILLLGVQGCGKSMAAKAVASAWGVPLLRLDFGALYNKYLGETERNLRESLKTADAMAPCVLWLDEIEKGLATSDADGGESRRLLGTLLTWMAERKARVFMIATSNDIERLPPELVRKGRVDEIFFVDLPAESQRAQILAIHLKRRGHALEQFDLPALAKTAESFSGAELEQAVVAAMYAARLENKALEGTQVAAEMARTKPLAVVMAEKIAYLRLWARDRTVPAD
ncbi:ATP-dependent zinc metalloprotease FtsH 1 [Burkholderiales bacterium]|nr:ATP-dependent zinc metalloprotease FtsH 1 [Burkholderiales bacterium]